MLARYVDLIGNFTSLVHGNAYPPIVEAAGRQVRRGTAWPARNDHHLELAELLIERVGSLEQVRFCNSGSEATMLALAIAREVTGRRGVLMARYGYHGCLDEFEAGFLEDFATMIRKLVPSDAYYAHDDWDRRTENVCEEDMEVGNGHSHCMSMLLGSAGESIPVRDGELALGQWQRVLFIELDRERDRRWLVQVVGS